MGDIKVTIKIQQDNKIIEDQHIIKQKYIDESDLKPKYALRNEIDELTDQIADDWVHGYYDKPSLKRTFLKLLKR
ncbi:MAG: hypothetical protein WC365_06370 [Candidatus Babeliales bacterium]|jgi:LPS sulfotransferase NodH